jgi:hypothetical protein
MADANSQLQLLGVKVEEQGNQWLPVTSNILKHSR